MRLSRACPLSFGFNGEGLKPYFVVSETNHEMRGYMFLVARRYN